ncbi:MAG: hypothetical protein EP338_00335 [Bacteroidetes bacterium]|nr:MAG: hypothetical protein EP338_00335 [Bacteroidota bacterium]
MKQLISIEFAKLRKLNSIKIILLIYAAMVPAWMFFLDHFYNLIITPLLPFQKALWAFPIVWNFTTFSASFFNILVGVIVVTVVCNEYNFRTMKQNVIDGMTKSQIIASKFVVVFGLATVVTLYTALAAFVLGMINHDGTSFYENSHYIFVYYLQALGYFSFAFFFALLIRKPALAIILFVVSFIAEWIIGIALTIGLKNGVYNYFPLNAFSKLTPSPLLTEFKKINEQQAAAQGKKAEIIEELSLSDNVWLSVGYICIFFAIAYLVLRKRDL